MDPIRLKFHIEPALIHIVIYAVQYCHDFSQEISTHEHNISTLGQRRWPDLNILLTLEHKSVIRSATYRSSDSHKWLLVVESFTTK